jgi:lycopene cyclase domain-containing protein
VEYLLLLISILTICLIVNLKLKIQIFQSTKQAIIALAALVVIGSTLDSFAVFRGYWSYNVNEGFFAGIKIGVLPLEEYLFMVVIPYLTLTVYGLTRKYLV